MATRKERGLKERIYLFNASLHKNNKWNLLIKGSSARSYNIIISDSETMCQCMDFTIRKKICKHLYFMLGRIINDYEIEKKIMVVNDITNNFSLISKSLESVLCNHIQNKTKNESIVYDRKDKCCICFEEFGDECIKECKFSCNNVFHTDCINLWLSKNDSCPLCRCNLNTNTNDNPLDKFESLSLEV